MASPFLDAPYSTGHLRLHPIASRAVVCAGSSEPTAFARSVFRTSLAVIAKRAIPLGNGSMDAGVARPADEGAAFGRVAHDPIEDRSQRLGALQAHVVVGLIDDQLHRGE